MHYYGWLTNYSTNQATVTANLAADIAQAQTITSANGTVPVLIGEYGNSTSGVAIDANANQVISAVQNSGFGSAAWAWGTGNPGDGLTTVQRRPVRLRPAGGLLDRWRRRAEARTHRQDAARQSWGDALGERFGPGGGCHRLADGCVRQYLDHRQRGRGRKRGGRRRQRQRHGDRLRQQHHLAGERVIAVVELDRHGVVRPATGTSTSPLPAAPPPKPVASPNDTVVLAGSASAITDASGNSWTLVNGVVDENGAAAGYSSGVAEIAYVNGTIWQENASSPVVELDRHGRGRPARAPAPARCRPRRRHSRRRLRTIPRCSPVRPPRSPMPSGNTWTITSGGQVAVNGVADTTTANVTELAYVNNEVWQENTANLWWGKTSPSAAWAPDSGNRHQPVAGADNHRLGHHQQHGHPERGVRGGDGRDAPACSSRGPETSSACPAGPKRSPIPAATTPTSCRLRAKATDAFTSNILTIGDTLDLKPALAATNWNGHVLDPVAIPDGDRHNEGRDAVDRGDIRRHGRGDWIDQRRDHRHPEQPAGALDHLISGASRRSTAGAVSPAVFRCINRWFPHTRSRAAQPAAPRPHQPGA